MPQLPPTSVAQGILGNPRLRALIENAQIVQQLEAPVGTEAYALDIPDFDRQGTVAVFDEVVDVSGKVSLEAAMRIDAASQAAADPFGTGTELEAPAGTSWAEVDLTIGGTVGAQGSSASGPLTISAKGSLTRGIGYRHVIPVRQDTRRLVAFSRLLQTTRPPQLVELSKTGLAQGEAHRLEATLNLDFNLDVQAGRKFAIDKAVALFEGLPAADLKLSGEMTISAALGLSLYERMYLAVGRDDRWARTRLQRDSERRIGFGAMMALQAEYDLGGSLAAVLEQALDQSPIPRLVAAARAIVDPVAAGDWDAIRQRLTGKLADAVGEWVDDTGWKEWLEDSDEVARLLAASRQIVDFYDGLDARVQSLWDQLLGKADLGPGSKIRTELDRLAQLDAAGFDLGQLVDPSGDAAKLVDLIETLSGKSLEEILLSSTDQIGETLGEVAELARKAEALFDLDDEIVAGIRHFADRTGIAATIDKLHQLPADTAGLEAMIGGRLRKLIETLAEKAWEQIRPADLARIQRWAQRISDMLGGVDELEAELLQKIRDVRGEIGFSLALEISRVSTATALLDVEIDLENEPDFRQAVEQALRGARVRELINALAARADNDDKADTLPFRLRECAFTSRRVRSSSASFVLSLLGPLGKFIEKQAGVSRRIEESTVRVDQVGEELRRKATFSGGFQRTEIWNKTTSDSALWLEIQASDPEKMPRSIAGRFGREDSRALRATYSREDSETTVEEIQTIAAQMERLGMAGGADLEKVPPRVQTRLSVDIRVPGEAVGRFCAAMTSESAWNEYYLRAGRRWFGDQLVGKPFNHDVDLGEVLAVFIRTNKFLDEWTGGVGPLGRSLATGNQGDRFRIPVRGRDVTVQPVSAVAATGMPRFDADFHPAGEIARKRAGGFRRIAVLGKAMGDAGRSRTPSAYERATCAFSDAWKAATAYSTSWPTPTFGMWLLMARLSEPDMRQLLADATGLAMLRWKNRDGWQGPVTWRLAKGGATPPPLLV